MKEINSIIQVKHNNNVKHISIRGEMETEEEVSYFSQLIREDNSTELCIAFFNADTLPSVMIDILYSLQKQRKYKIYIYQRHLYSYLYDLGIRSLFFRRKNIQRNIFLKKNGEIAENLKKEEIIWFLQELRSLYGCDFTGYHLNSIKRRLKVAMIRENIQDFQCFQKEVFEKPEAFRDLFIDFSITITDFFRDPEVFAFLRNNLFPLLKTHDHINIWSAGCSMGKEAYSLAMLLDEYGILEKVKIYATDFNPYIIKGAKNGLFSMSTIEKDILNYRLASGSKNFVSYFDLKGHYMRIKERLQNNIVFLQHDLIKGDFLGSFHLILCRNVLIYFNAVMQAKVLHHLSDSLNEQGFLILGKSEGILQNKEQSPLKSYDDSLRIFKKI